MTDDGFPYSDGRSPLERLTDALDAIADETHGALTLGEVSPECAVVSSMCDGDLHISGRRVAQRVWLLEKGTASLLVELAAVDQALLDEHMPVLIDGQPQSRFGRIRALGDKGRRAEWKLSALGEGSE